SGISLRLGQCSTARKSASKTTEPTAGATLGEIKRNYTPAQMEEGKVIWQDKCDKCHKLYDPASHTVVKWEMILPRMSQKAKLTEEEAGKVRAFILTNAKS